MKQLVAALMLATVPTIVAAEPVQVSRSVTTADLDLTSTAGQRTLDRRLAVAIDDACGEASNVDLAGRNDIRDCRANAWAKVQADRDQRLAGAGRSKPTVQAGR